MYHRCTIGVVNEITCKNCMLFIFFRTICFYIVAHGIRLLSGSKKIFKMKAVTKKDIVNAFKEKKKGRNMLLYMYYKDIIFSRSFTFRYISEKGSG